MVPRPSSLPNRLQRRAQTASVHRDMHKINADVLGDEEVRDFSRRRLRFHPFPE